jgi:hypothetical protein
MGDLGFLIPIMGIIMGVSIPITGDQAQAS